MIEFLVSEGVKIWALPVTALLAPCLASHLYRKGRVFEKKIEIHALIVDGVQLARRDLQNVRSGLSTWDPADKRIENLLHSSMAVNKPVTNTMISAQEMIERYHDRRETWIALDDLVAKGKVYFGDKVMNAVIEIRRIQHHFHVDLQTIRNGWGKPDTVHSIYMDWQGDTIDAAIGRCIDDVVSAMPEFSRKTICYRIKCFASKTSKIAIRHLHRSSNTVE